jgi:hypothetical protein
MEEHMRERIEGVAEDLVLAPVAAELQVCARFGADVDALRH